MRKKLFGEIQNINEKIINNSLLAFALTYLPIMVVSVMRSIATKWTLFSYLLPIFMTYFIVVYLFRRMLPYLFRKYSLIIVIVIIASFSYYSNGMLGLGGAILIMAVVLVALTSTMKETVVFLGIGAAIIIVFRNLISQHIIPIVFDIEVFFYSQTAWNGQLIGYLTIVAVLLVATLTLVKGYKHVLLEMEFEGTSTLMILDNLEDPYFSIDRNKNLQLVSVSFRKAMGLGDVEILGKPMSFLFNLKAFDEVSKQVELRKYLEKVMTENKSLCFQTYFMVDDKRKVNKCKMIPVLNDTDEIEMVIVQYTDVTDIISDYSATSERLMEENRRMKQIIKEQENEMKKNGDDRIK